MFFKHLLNVVVVIEDNSTNFYEWQRSINAEILKRTRRNSKHSSHLMGFEPFSRGSNVPLAKELLHLFNKLGFKIL